MTEITLVAKSEGLERLVALDIANEVSAQRNEIATAGAYAPTSQRQPL